MKRYFKVGIIFGIMMAIGVVFSWIKFPAWQNPSSGGFWALLGTTLVTVLVVVQNLVSIWKDLKEEKNIEASKLLSGQSIGSQNANSIFNVLGGSVNITQQLNTSDSEEQLEKNDLSDIEVENKEDITELNTTVFDGLNWEAVSSSIIFDGRLRDAFPGLRDIRIFQGEEAVNRLGILLDSPLSINNREGGRIIPFWWFRGYSSMYIERFEKINSEHILLDIFEMKIDYIAAIRKFNVEERNFVYVQVSPSIPTGLYNYDSGWVENYLQEQLKKNYGYYLDEEYAVWGNHLITRAEYDDGSAIINEKPVKTIEAELRARYITPYNFILCGQNHVINSFDKVDIEMNSLMNELLLGTKTIDDLVNFIERLPNTSRYRVNY